MRRPFRGVGAAEPWQMAWGGTRPALAHNTTTPGLHCAAHTPWAVGRYSTRRNARGPRATEFERGDHELSVSVPPTCRDVGAVEPWPTVWRGVRPALAYNTTTPSPHCAARVVRGRSTGRPIIHGAKSAQAARHGIRTRRLRTFEVRPADLSRRWSGRSPYDGVGRNAPRVDPQHNHAKSALRCACYVSDRPILHEAKSARAARHRIQTP